MVLSLPHLFQDFPQVKNAEKPQITPADYSAVFGIPKHQTTAVELVKILFHEGYDRLPPDGIMIVDQDGFIHAGAFRLESEILSIYTQMPLLTFGECLTEKGERYFIQALAQCTNSDKNTMKLFRFPGGTNSQVVSIEFQPIKPDRVGLVLWAI